MMNMTADDKLPTGMRIYRSPVDGRKFLTPIEGADQFDLFAKDGSLFRQIILRLPPPQTIEIPIPSTSSVSAISEQTPDTATLNRRTFRLVTRYLPGGSNPMYSYKEV